MNRAFALAAVLAVTSAYADNYTALTPPTIQKFQAELGDQKLYLEFCLVGGHVCVERQAIAWGQVCDAQLAGEMGRHEHGAVDGVVPPGFIYHRFRCKEGGKWHEKDARIFGGGNFMD